MDNSTQERMINFLERKIDATTLAKHLRRFKYESLKMFLESESEGITKEWISNGHYFLTELCEILDPQLLDDEK